MIIRIAAAVSSIAFGVLVASPAHADGPNCVPMTGHAFVNLCRMPDNTLAGCPQIGGMFGTSCQPETPENRKLLSPDQAIPPPLP